MSSDPVLVTGACGLAGSATVRRLVADGRRVIATDLDSAATRKTAATLPAGAEVRYADLTNDQDVATLVAQAAPAAIIHLAAIIPPVIYGRRELARRVNVEGTASLLSAAENLPSPPRFILASSVAVYGSRNPHRTTDLLTPATPLHPVDIYGLHKVEAENLVRSAQLDWVILRLGALVSVELGAQSWVDFLYLDGSLPIDGRVHTIDVRDVAGAFAAATTADAVGETLLVGGNNDTHCARQGDVSSSLAAAMGLVNALPRGLKGDPDDDTAWFTTDWMDTARAEDLLHFQHRSWPDMLAEASTSAAWFRFPLRVAAPIIRQVLKYRSPYHGSGKKYADPWGRIRAKWGDPTPDEAPGQIGHPPR